MDNIYILREQFPITSSYGITVHKSQGISLENAIVEAGNSIFSNGQTYVALSRVTRLEGLHLINFDPSCCTADRSAILEYNRLRATVDPNVRSLQIPRTKKDMVRCKIRDSFTWRVAVATHHENSELNLLSNDYWNIRGLPNTDVSCYANACLQSLLHSTTVRRVLLQHSHDDFMRSIFDQYISKSPVDMEALRRFVHDKYTESVQQDAAEFLNHLCDKSVILRDIIQHDLLFTIRCPSCNVRSETTNSNFILSVPVPQPTRTYTLQEIIDYNFEDWRDLDGLCGSRCKSKKLQKTNVHLKNTVLIIQLLLFTNKGEKIQKITDFKLKDVPKAKITIDKKTYTVISGIFHHGRNPESGHYTNVLRQNKSWMKVNDLVIEKKQWPKCAKDIYILFLERSDGKL